MPTKRDKPYIWVTWLTKLLVGESSCEWAAWFRAQHYSESYDKVPNPFDLVGWQMEHTSLLNQKRDELESEGQKVFLENQNSFTLRGNTAALGGKPDLIAVSGVQGLILDVKTGKPALSHAMQLMVYMYAIPRALGQHQGIRFDGKVVYTDSSQNVDIPHTAIDDTFIRNLADLIRRVSSETPARKVPSQQECSFCNITSADCPERVVEDVLEEGTTDDF
ncbi:MAG: PD-(D/E)XK nuclease family protein [Chloroflexi bacterium]|nr:PD-(D/E)XK nuclease family protein [Chloroflexota bacterium]